MFPCTSSSSTVRPISLSAPSVPIDLEENVSLTSFDNVGLFIAPNDTLSPLGSNKDVNGFNFSKHCYKKNDLNDDNFCDVTDSSCTKEESCVVGNYACQYNVICNHKKDKVSNVCSNSTSQEILKTLSFLSLNVCGLRNRLKHEEFISYVTQFDIIVLLETKTDHQDRYHLEEAFSELGYYFVLLSGLQNISMY